MVKLIMGRKGTGKTKKMIELVNEATAHEQGLTICLEHGQKLTFDINYAVRLVDTKPYDIRSYQVLRGFITGLYAGNFDITHVFIDSLFKVSGESDMAEADKFVAWAKQFGTQNNIRFTISVSEDASLATEGMRALM